MNKKREAGISKALPVRLEATFDETIEEAHQAISAAGGVFKLPHSQATLLLGRILGAERRRAQARVSNDD